MNNFRIEVTEFFGFTNNFINVLGSINRVDVNYSFPLVSSSLDGDL